MDDQTKNLIKEVVELSKQVEGAEPMQACLLIAVCKLITAINRIEKSVDLIGS